jgi:hypothetical protein
MTNTWGAAGQAAAGPRRCRACGAELAEGAAVCNRCGTAQNMSTCPLCGATTGVSPDPEFRFKCDVCGGPRVPEGSAAIRRSGKENTALKAVDDAWKGRATGRATAIVGGVGAAFSMFVVLVTWLATSLGYAMIPLVLLVVPFAALLAWGMGRAKKRGAEIQPALDAAWLAAATDVAAQSRGQLSAADLSAALGIDEAKAEELLAMVDVHRAMGGGALPKTDAMAAFDAKLRVASQAGGLTDAQAAEREVEAEAEAAQAAARARTGREP